jgi:hypothetical protein
MAKTKSRLVYIVETKIIFTLKLLECFICQKKTNCGTAKKLANASKIKIVNMHLEHLFGRKDSVKFVPWLL